MSTYRIYSNDGNTTIKILETTNNNPLILDGDITKNGFTCRETSTLSNPIVWTYNYDTAHGVFKGLSTARNASLPDTGYEVNNGNGQILQNIMYIVDQTKFTATIDATNCHDYSPTSSNISGAYTNSFTANSGMYITRVLLNPSKIGTIEFDEDYKTANVYIENVLTDFTITVIAAPVTERDIVLHPMIDGHQNYAIHLLPKVRTTTNIATGSKLPASGEGVFGAIKGIIPDIQNNKYLHTNKSTGNYEWTKVRDVIEYTNSVPVANETSPDFIMLEGHLYYKVYNEGV